MTVLAQAAMFQHSWGLGSVCAARVGVGLVGVGGRKEGNVCYTTTGPSASALQQIRQVTGVIEPVWKLIKGGSSRCSI